MTKILIDEAVVRQAQMYFNMIATGDNLDWIKRQAGEQAEALRQAIANAALDKMAENARELGLSYEQSAQQEPDDERIAALRTLDYCHGLKAGWNFCVANDEAGFERAMDSTSEAVRILKEQPAPAQQQPLPLDKDGWWWVSENECISGDIVRKVEAAHRITKGAA